MIVPGNVLIGVVIVEMGSMSASRSGKGREEAREDRSYEKKKNRSEPHLYTPDYTTKESSIISQQSCDSGNH
jgi:hypothetical protein